MGTDSGIGVVEHGDDGDDSKMWRVLTELMLRQQWAGTTDPEEEAEFL
jgi:hypothetical protein